MHMLIYFKAEKALHGAHLAAHTDPDVQINLPSAVIFCKDSFLRFETCRCKLAFSISD